MKFKETCIKLLDSAHKQAKERLEKFINSLERVDVSVIRGRKTLRAVPRGEAWFVTAHHKDCWLFRLPIHGVSGKARFPDLLKLPEKTLEKLQLGWRTSDECDSGGKLAMGTTHADLLLAWATTRYGLLLVRIDAIHLNKSTPTIKWSAVAAGWKQQ